MTNVSMKDIIRKIYEWNDRVDSMRTTPVWFNLSQALWYLDEEIREFNIGKGKKNNVEMADALADIFVVCIWEFKKMGVSLEKIQTLFDEEDKLAQRWFHDLTIVMKWGHQFLVAACNAIHDLDLRFPTLRNKILVEVVGKLFTRFGSDCYIDENNKFRKSTDFVEPNLDFVK